MKKFLKNKKVGVVVSLSMVVLVWVSANMNWGDERWKGILGSDGLGYYAYLPAAFIYNDLSFSYYNHLGEIIPEENFNFNFRRKWNESTVNKYYVGTSVANSPFFLLGHLATMAFGLPQDGYSKFYLVFWQIGALFYLLIGALFVVKILREYHISENVQTFVVVALIFGTNLFHYTIHESSCSHVFSFAFTAIYVYSFIRFFKEQSAKSLIVGCFALGMIILIRPVNGLVVFALPFLAGSWTVLLEGFRYLKKHLLLSLLGLLVLVAILSIQLAVYKIQTGDFLVYSYGEEGFDFSSFHFFDFLISYRKGYFIYTPIALLSLFGLYFIYRKSRFEAVSFVLFFVLVVYIFSSWRLWWYGGSFSQRVMVEYLPFFSIPLAFLLQQSKWRKLWFSIAIMLILVCQVQTYQYKKGYIHWSDMNKERYWSYFLRVDKVVNKAEKDW